MKRQGILWSILLVAGQLWSQETVITGEYKKWHDITITFTGPAADENDAATFWDYRLTVTFTNGGNSYVVPGYFAADGNAAYSLATAGNKWRVHFCPDATGEWTYTASFRTGADVAISLDPDAGTPTAPIDGLSDTFTVGPTDKTGRDLRGKGMLRYIGEHYLQFTETGEYFMKGAPDSPEDFLGYEDFDGTYDAGGSNFPSLGGDQLHAYANHVQHWQEGDTAWGASQEKGKGIIGALNYLSSQKMNAVYFLLNNLEGDHRNSWPWIREAADAMMDVNGDYKTHYQSSSTEVDIAAVSNGQYDIDFVSRFDCSKLDQWNIVFTHMDKVGIQMHALLGETENEQMFEALEGLPKGDNVSSFARTRKLFYREMIARFAHHLALRWSLGEENRWDTYENKQPSPTFWQPYGLPGCTPEQQLLYSEYIHGVDPYDHEVGIHTIQDILYPGDYLEYFTPLYGSPYIDAAALQGNPPYVYPWVLDIYEKSAAAGHPMVVTYDEVFPNLEGDLSNLDERRKNAMWINAFMAGASGIEWMYNAGWEDFSEWEPVWQATAIALEFFQNYTQFWNMAADKDLVTGTENYCLAQPGEAYVVYLRDGGSASLNLAGQSGDFDVFWYDPRNGGALQQTATAAVSGGGPVDLGTPPDAAGDDWVVLVRSPDYAAGTNLNKAKAAPNDIRMIGSKCMFTTHKPEEVEIGLRRLDGTLVAKITDGRVSAGEHAIDIGSAQNSPEAYVISVTIGDRTHLKLATTLGTAAIRK